MTPSSTSRALALAALTALCTSPALVAQDDICEDDGLIVIEVERSPATDSWQVETSVGGYTGDSYYRWSGPDLFNSPGSQGLLSYTFEVETEGEYELRIRNYHDDPDATMNNDCWSRVDGSTWVKTYSKFKDAWVWSTRFDIHNEPTVDASYYLTPGTHTLELSARSNGFHMDRIHFYLPGNPDGENENVGETFCSIFTDLGNGLAGVNGVPVHGVEGTLLPGDPAFYRLADAAPNATSYFVFGFFNISANFKGGVLVPSVDILVPVPLNAAGGIFFPLTWPANSPPGIDVFTQFWTVDPAGPFGFSASNAVQGVTQ